MTTDQMALGPLPADSTLMRRALDLASRSVGLAHPNPHVGAIVVRGHQKVGEGFHVYDHRDHAEIVALKQAGEKARGATLYVTLEPCCTTGRTGPCTKAIIEAGITRVVAATKDPNPAVAGRGFAELKRAGIDVVVGSGEDSARHLNEDFAKWIRTGKPLITLKSALTLDGQIAERAGVATQITSEASREEVQRMRHQADAVLTGIGTVLADDPRLTDRTGLPRRRKLLRAVLDSWLRIPLASQLVKSADGDVVVFATPQADSAKARALERAGVEVLFMRSRHDRVLLGPTIGKLGKRGILNLMLEAGAELNSAALDAGIVDKMVLFYAPRIMGARGVPLARLSRGKLSKLPALSNLTVRQFGPDFAVEGYFHDVYGNHRARRKN